MRDKEKSFEDLMNELDEILKKLNDSKISLDDAVKGYLKGLEVSKACNEILNQNKELVVKKMTEFGLEDLESDGKLEEFNKNL